MFAHRPEIQIIIRKYSSELKTKNKKNMNEIVSWSSGENWSSSRKDHVAENVEECPLLQSWEERLFFF